MKKFIIITIIVLIYAIPLSFPKVRNSIKGKIENIYLNLKYPYQVEIDFSKAHSFKNRAENLSGFCGIWILFKEKGILDDDLNFVPFSN